MIYFASVLGLPHCYRNLRISLSSSPTPSSPFDMDTCAKSIESADVATIVRQSRSVGLEVVEVKSCERCYPYILTFRKQKSLSTCIAILFAKPKHAPPHFRARKWQAWLYREAKNPSLLLCNEDEVLTATIEEMWYIEWCVILTRYVASIFELRTVIEVFIISLYFFRHWSFVRLLFRCYIIQRILIGFGWYNAVRRCN